MPPPAAAAAAPVPARVQELARKWAPVFCFDRQDQYMPSSAEFFLEHADVVLPDGTALPVTDEALREAPQGSRLIVRDDHLESVLPGNKECAKVYLHAKPEVDGTVEIQYWVYLPYNGPCTLGVYVHWAGRTWHEPLYRAGKLGQHDGDWEHVTALVRVATGELEGIYFSQHATGQYIPRKGLTMRKGRPLVFAARDSHACYPTSKKSPGHKFDHHMHDPTIKNDFVPRKDFKIVCFGVRQCNITSHGGFELDALKRHQWLDRVEGDAAEPPAWASFRGRWGRSELKETDDTSGSAGGDGEDGESKVEKEKRLYVEPLMDDILIIIQKNVATHNIEGDPDGGVAPKLRKHKPGALNVLHKGLRPQVMKFVPDVTAGIGDGPTGPSRKGNYTEPECQ